MASKSNEIKNNADKGKSKESFLSVISNSTLEQKIIIALAASITLAGFALRVKYAIKPIDHLLSVSLADDAFYYLEIARNILAGNGVTFDGIIPTNGFHPAYMAVCVLIRMIFTDGYPVLPVLIFFSFIGAANILLLFFVGRKIGGSLSGLVAASFWAFHPEISFRELGGVEAPMAVTAMLITLLWWMGIKEKIRTSYRSWILLGIFVGFCFLCRTDTIFFILFLAGEIVFVFRKELTKHIKKIIISGVAASAVVAPWIGWNLWKFGRISQDSGRTLLYYANSFYEMGNLQLWPHLKKQFLFGIENNLLQLTGLPAPYWSVIIILGCAFSAIFLSFYAKDKHPGIWKTIPSFVFMGISSWLFYNLLFWPHHRFWYMISFMALLALLFGRAVQLFTERFFKLRWVLILLIALAIFPAWYIKSVEIERDGYHSWQKTKYEIALKIKDGLVKGIEPDDILGSWNSGVYSAFTNHRVINLDGVVNPEIYQVLEKKEMIKYIKGAGVKHIIDHWFFFKTYQKYSYLRFEDHFKLTASFQIPNNGGRFVILSLIENDESDIKEE